MQPQTTIDPTDLMDQLITDSEGKIRDAAVRRIKEIERGVKRTLDAGVSPAEFQVLSKVHSALEQAAAVVDDSWSLVRKFKKGQSK
jgi:hypothetical protein